MGKSIEWGKSWNPVKGLCPHSSICEYCYMAGFHKRFSMDPTLRLDEKALAHVPKGDRIFVCSNLDLFADAIPEGWIYNVIISIHDHHDWGQEFFFLTKNPKRYANDFKYQICPYMWLGTTWDGLPFTHDNVRILYSNGVPESGWFVSFEPLLSSPEKVDISSADWIIIGADSRRGQPKPPKEWADCLIEQARELQIPVFVKSNYGYPETIQEFPEQRR